ncbi:MAG: ankyrin repeat domain-containing protein [Legionella sp.]|nr:ankyrin repeat domain-containing protein [Legionella sp.]
MRDFSDLSLTYSELLTQLKKNESSCTKLILQSDQLDSLNPADRQEFCTAIEQNHTLTSLSIDYNAIDEAFCLDLIRALQNNQSITTLSYNKDNLPQDLINTVQEILDRNRKLAIDRPINPTLIDGYIRYKQVSRAFEAAKTGDLNLLHTLIENNRELLHEVDFLGKSLLHIAAKHGQVDCVKLLLRAGAEVDYNLKTYMGTQEGTALHEAVNANNIVITQLLLTAGASVTSRQNGFTPLHNVNDLEIARLLVANKADIHALCDKTQVECCRENSVLHSVLHGKGPHPDLLRFLIENGANVNATNAHGEIPVHFLVMHPYQTPKGFSDRLKVLVEAGANLLHRDNCGRTPLRLAKVVNSKWVSGIEEATEDYRQKCRAPDSFFSGNITVAEKKVDAASLFSPFRV